MPEPRLRVALLARSVFPLHGVGGLERHVYDLVRHLARRGVAVTLITRPPAPGGPAGDPAAIFGVERERLRLVTAPYVTFPFAGRRGTTVIDRSTAYPVFGWRAGRIAVRLARLGEVEVVHALGASGLGYAMARLRHEPTVPFVLNPQGLEEFGATHPGFARLKRLAYTPLQAAVRTCARAADVVIATDDVLVAPVRLHLRTPAAQVRVVPNAVDLEELDGARTRADAGAVRARHGLGPDEPLLLSLGRHEENKGFHVLAEALGRLQRRSGRRWRWVLVGEGPYRAAIERAAAGAGVASRMIVPGRVGAAELADWLTAADLFVHPTLYEGSSLVTLEAMAYGKAVVATRAGGLPDKVQPGVTGWLVEPGDPAALAEALDDALADPARLVRYGEAGRALVERRFAWPAVADTLIGIYTDLLARHPPGQDPLGADRA